MKHPSYQQVYLVPRKIYVYHINKDEEVYESVDSMEQMNKESSWLFSFIHNDIKNANEPNQVKHSQALARLV